MQTLELQVEQDHIESIAKVRNPIVAIEELIWNALDADANRIAIRLFLNSLDGLETITVSDNGTGIRYEECKDAFGHLGGSRKQGRRLTAGGRVLHGQLGKGRFRAFGIGQQVTWKSRYQLNGVVKQFEIKGARNHLKRFDVGDEITAPEKPTGVEVTIHGIGTNFPALMNPVSAAEELSKRLALYLRMYPGIEIRYNDVQIDVSRLESHSATYSLKIPDKDGVDWDAELTVIEWNTPTDRALYFCDESGFALDEQVPGVKAPGFHFTAYLKSNLIPGLVDDGLFAFESLHPIVASIRNVARNTLRSHFREREASRAIDLVQQWQSENVYPYCASEQDPLKQVEREVFDVCALKVHEYLPDFDKTEAKTKRLTFRLLREALANNPTTLQTILRQVLELPQEQQDDLASILCRTHLAAIINAAKTVVDRLDFICSLNSLLFGEFKNTLLERAQLHRILVEELWIFGEQYTLGVDDESLSSVLRKHISILEREELSPTSSEPVLDLAGRKRIIDLMLYRRIPQSQPNQFEHLVIELKRPNCKLGQKELGQIENYAFSVASDERFDRNHTRWTFVLIGNDLDPFAIQKSRVQGREFGHIHQSDDGAVNIHVKKWSTIIAEATWRHQFFREKLELQVTTADGLQYLRKRHRDRLPNNATGDA